MKARGKSTAVIALIILTISFAVAPIALAISSAPNYPFELTGRVEYVVPAGTPNLFGHVGQMTFDNAPAVDPVGAFSWAPTSSYSTSPGHGL
jgi:hypothetical protein